MITQEYLKSRLYYDPLTGQFTWIKSGKTAGTLLADGRWQIQIQDRLYKAHRLAWFYTHGVWPVDQIDHKDGDPLNNRLTNLRECNQVQNQQNQHRPRAHNKTGYLGVSYEPVRKKYAARIRVGNKYLYLGRYDTAVDASEAYQSAKKKYHPFHEGNKCEF